MAKEIKQIERASVGVDRICPKCKRLMPYAVDRNVFFCVKGHASVDGAELK